MASGIANLGAARRGLIKSEKKYAALSDTLGTISTVMAFTGVQLDKSKTAWDEYERGYKELGGDPADIPERTGLFKHFQMPKGEVKIDDKIYDRKKVQQVGSFLGEDTTASILAMGDPKAMRDKYLELFAPGRDLTDEEIIGSKLKLEGRSWEWYNKLDAVAKKEFMVTEGYMDPVEVKKTALRTYEEGVK